VRRRSIRSRFGGNFGLPRGKSNEATKKTPPGRNATSRTGSTYRSVELLRENHRPKVWTTIG
jgi:hypothetical protein